ncbi:MAG: hypothetical protein ACRDL5_14880, partial [Solirubrobacteraceae bacterium]
ARIELLLPAGVRPRQLTVRTLLVGMLLVAADRRPMFLSNIHHALSGLDQADRWRLGIISQWKTGPHRLTYRQVERTFKLVVRALAKDKPDGSPAPILSDTLERLLEASITVLGPPASSSYTVDWSDLEAWARPPHKPADPGEPDADDSGPDDDAEPDRDLAEAEQSSTDQDARRGDREAAWGHRNTNHPAKNEMFYGYYLQALTTVADEHGPAVPELIRRIQIGGCQHDPPAQIVPVLERMHTAGIKLGDLLADPGYAYRVPERWALPVRSLGIDLIQDLHPNDRGPQGTHHGAVLSNGNLYCPATPTALLELSPLAPAATSQQTETHDQQTGELTKHKLSPVTSYDHDGYRRVTCPATTGKIRCPLRPVSMTLTHEHPTITSPPEHPPVCCTQQTITVPPTVNAKTVQKHDYPSAKHRASYQRRTAAERTFSTLYDPAANNLSRGWCRTMGLSATALLTATVTIARNIRIQDTFNARQAENQRRAANGLPPRQRRRRRQTTTDLINATGAPP